MTPYIGSIAQTPKTVSASASSTTVTGLTNGESYTFKVSATNSNGDGDASAASNAVTPRLTIFEFADPGAADGGDGSSVELGVKFTSDVDGEVRGIRFYKASTNTGTHIGSLWTAGGTRLAQVTFSDETGSGWQSATFSDPVSVTAGTTYVASYFAPNGHYSVTAAASRRPSTTRRCTRSATRRARTASTPTAPRRRSRRAASTRATTPSTCCSARRASPLSRPASRRPPATPART